MELDQAHIRPGRVLSVDDEKGTIKACCCGLFSDEDEPEKLPPIYQFPLGGANNYSSPKVDDEVWVLFFDDNPLELFYIRKDNFSENLQDILSKKYDEVEVLASRDLAQGMVQLYFTDGEGWIIRNVDSVIQMRKDGSILLDSGSAHRKIDLCDNSISLGSEGGSEHPAALGDKVVNSLNILNDLLSAMEESAKSSPYTMALSTALTTLRPMFEDSIEEITSNHVTLD
jgi:hypothetical protein